MSAALGIELGEEALRRVRLVQLHDGSPQSLVTAWFPAAVADACPRLAQNAPIAEGTTNYVRRQTGRFPVEGTDITTVRLGSDAEARHLSLEQPVAVAVVLHTAYDQDGQALVCEEGVTPSHLYEEVDNYPMS
ncbi:hypothetical protein SVIO_111960 [Streptomyces violaceusniger]|uniref:UbiC transcription regulator-associated domain-containing protein n=1 Tax=Streptomyces violaceusniger TaxID=68280 RepID=A0A4D4LR65_STRVO|nr:hypothetical protein SVIO_111960 [Streptomyces violaceusniger]